MEQPKHDLRGAGTTATQGMSRRVIAGAAAVALQIAVIYALAAGLAAQLISKLPEELKAEVVQEKIPNKIPPPPPPDLVKPPPPYVPPPEIQIQTEAPAQTITTQSTAPAPPPPKAAPQISSPASIGRPHVCMQDYPPISQRLNEQGTTVLAFHITADGGVTGVTVARSSGHDRLDQAAVSCAQNWHYKPAMQNGQPVEVPWQAQVKWQLSQ